MTSSASNRNYPTRIDDNLPLYLGSADNADPQILQELNITIVLNCAAELLSLYTYDTNIIYHHLPLRDSSDYDIEPLLKPAIQFIWEHLQQGRGVLVHCLHGVSRSATICIAFNIWLRGDTFDNMFKRIKQLRPCINPNLGFVLALEYCEPMLHAMPCPLRLSYSVPTPVEQLSTPHSTLSSW